MTKLLEGGEKRLEWLTHQKVSRGLLNGEEEEFKILWEAASETLKGKLICVIRYDGLCSD